MIAIDEWMDLRIPRQGRTLVDVGACDKGLVMPGWNESWLFEPDPRNIELLQKKYERMKKVHIVPVALGKKHTSAMLTLYDHNGLGTFHDDKLSWVGWRGKAREAIQVEVRPLDSYPIPFIDLIKIDTEGSELDVLRGAHFTILTSHPQLLIETHSHADHQEIVKLLQGWSYDIAGEGKAEGEKGFIDARPRA